MLWTARALVPFPQPDLVQYLLGVDNFLKVQSADARACISICRPKGHFVDRRDCGRAGTRATFMHQSGALPLQPLMPVQDDARGMLSTVVAKESFRKTMFELRPCEPEALAHVLPWLLENHIWFRGYMASMQEVQGGLQEMVNILHREGRLLPGGIDDLPTSSGKSLSECLAGEDIALLVPRNSLPAFEGSYQHLHAIAEIVFTSQLRSELPAEWQK